jgi:hypothetical protein
MQAMRKTVRLLATGVLLVLGTAAVAAAESVQSAGDHPQTGASGSNNDNDKHTGARSRKRSMASSIASKTIRRSPSDKVVATSPRISAPA